MVGRCLTVAAGRRRRWYLRNAASSSQGQTHPRRYHFNQKSPKRENRTDIEIGRGRERGGERGRERGREGEREGGRGGEEERDEKVDKEEEDEE